jgi:RND family efflux transporter MFP subunit
MHSKEEVQPNISPVNVSVKTISTESVKEQFDFTGRVISNNQTVLSTKLLGHVLKVLVEEGQQVSKGQLLIQLKSKDVESKLAAARAGRKEALAAQANIQKNFNRMQNLFDKGSATQRELDEITMQLDMVNARVESVDQNIAELNELLTYANLKSPIDGFVSKKFVNAGDMASPGYPLLSLESLSDLKIDLNIPEFEIGMFTKGDQVSVTFSTIGQASTATVSNVVPSTANGAQFKVSVVLNDSTNTIKPGMVGKVTVHKNGTQKLVLAEQFIHQKGQLNGVYTVNEQNQAMLRWVRLGETFDNGVEVLSGLTTGDRIITQAEARLVNGQPVVISK